MHQQRGRVLLVDGDSERSKRLAAQLARLELDVRLATNGAAALLAAHEQRPDVVIAAAELPVLDGYRMLDALRSKPQTQDIPVLLITEGDSHEELTRAWSVGADLCIPREAGEAELFPILKRALAGLRAFGSPPGKLALCC